MKRHHWASIGLVVGVALAVMPLVALKSSWATVLGRTIQNFGHIPLFGLITTLLLLLASRVFKSKPGPTVQYAGVLTIAMIVGVLTELVQMIGLRDADAWDLARNGVGVALALVWWATFDRRFDGSAIRRTRSRIVLRTATFVVALAFLLPLVGVVSAYLERAHRFPILFSFETESQRRFMNTRLASYTFTPVPDGWNIDSPARVARINFSRHEGGAIALSEPYPDWTGHTALVFELFHPGERRVEVGLRVDDQLRSVRYHDRFNYRAFLEPGYNRLRITMEEIVAGPTDRELDISSIARIIVFAVHPVGGFEIYLGPVRLETDQTATSSRSPD